MHLSTIYNGALPFWRRQWLGRLTCDQMVVSSTPGRALPGLYLDG